MKKSNSKLVGDVASLGRTCRRNRHSVRVGIGILQAFTGQGFGIKLLAELKNWPYRREIHRLDLTVRVHKERAISLYKRLVFKEEGIKRHSLFIDGAYVDEY